MGEISALDVAAAFAVALSIVALIVSLVALARS